MDLRSEPPPIPVIDLVSFISSVPEIEDVNEAAHTEPVSELTHETVQNLTSDEVIEKPSSTTEPSVQEPYATKPASFVTDFDKETDYEKYIGENLISKIGIAILVLAIGFFVKYAIDNNWIGPVGRVCVGLAAGGILVGVAHWMRQSYKAFSSVLVGGGLAVFYFTIALAYHEFHLFNQTPAFAIMVVITLFAVALSLLYDRQELAVISLVGGFATPFMVSNGSNNYIALFTYLTILNAGMLIIAYARIWRILNIVCFVFTIILFTTWLFTTNASSVRGMYLNGLLFATVYFIFFFTAAVAHNIREKKKFLPFDFGMLLINSVWYFGIGLYLLEEMHANIYRGFFSAAMAAFHLIISYILYRNKKVDVNILYLLIGITLTYISITAPLQLEGSFISLFWASEAVLLYWLYQRSGLRIIAIGSVIVWTVMVISIVYLWGEYYSSSALYTIIFNKTFITSLYATACSGMLYYLRGRDESTVDLQTGVYKLPRIVLLVSSIIMCFVTGALEISHQFGTRITDLSLSDLYLMLYLILFVYAVLLIAERSRLKYITKRGEAIVVAVLIVLYLCGMSDYYDTYNSMLRDYKYIYHFSAHWISAIAIMLLLRRLILLVKAQSAEWVQHLTSLTWLLGATAVLLLSTEGYFLVTGLFYSSSINFDYIDLVYTKACLPILWGLCSFVFMWLGMKYSYRHMRIMSLVLFALTLVKLFVYDISDVPVAGKIAAFFCLGVLLLVVSFMYQRLKKILVEDGHGEKV